MSWVKGGRRAARYALGVAVITVAAPALAQQRPTEDEMFGGQAPAAAAANAVPDGGSQPTAGENRPSEDSLFGGSGSLSETLLAPRDGGTDSRDESQLGGPALKSRFDTEEEKADPLKLGGTLYMRAMTTITDHTSFDKTAFSQPNLLDVFLDARPNERVRGMVVGRLRYDPTLQPSSTNTLTSQALMPQTVATPTANPAVFLDQLWLRFDIARTVFVTVGRQKVRWGTARLWTPTDFLNSARRDPLQPFDLRLGANMLKLHVPIESLGWNFYGYGLFDNVTPANVLGNIGGALRAEFVIPKLGTEIGLGGVWVRGARPRYAVDISSPLGPFDIYAEAAFRDGHDFTVWRVAEPIDLSQPLSNNFMQVQAPKVTTQVTAGASFSFNYTDNATATVGVEYFYNPVGANTPVLYPWLLLNNAFNPFYAGQHYGGAFVLFPTVAGLQWLTFNVTNLVNFSDLSGTARFDAFIRVLTYLQFEAFVAANYGTRGGEFRFALDLPSFPLGDGTFTQPITVNAPVASCGVGLRISI